MMSSPAVYPSNLAVASINSTINMQSVLSWTDAQGQSHTVPFSDPNEVAMKRKFPESQSFVVYDAGYGTYMDYYNAGFSNGYNGGKTGIALVKRGSADGSTLSFADKINNASSFSGTNYMGESYGVLAVLVYDSDPAATTLINMNTDNTSLTSAFISGVDGAAHDRCAERRAGGPHHRSPAGPAVRLGGGRPDVLLHLLGQRLRTGAEARDHRPRRQHLVHRDGQQLCGGRREVR